MSSWGIRLPYILGFIVIHELVVGNRYEPSNIEGGHRDLKTTQLQLGKAVKSGGNTKKLNKDYNTRTIVFPLD